jgi:hypothetical protein
MAVGDVIDWEFMLVSTKFIAAYTVYWVLACKRVTVNGPQVPPPSPPVFPADFCWPPAVGTAVSVTDTGDHPGSAL